ncbi:unnamed protein product [Absidia cylindrospora]
MSVLVTTTFSQGAVFYAGETLSCTIAFTNTLPLLQKPPSASSSLTRQDRHKSPPPRLSHHNNNHQKVTNGKGHSRSPSASSSHDTIPEYSSSELDTSTFMGIQGLLLLWRLRPWLILQVMPAILLSPRPTLHQALQKTTSWTILWIL